jgi:hypothetical protein
MGSTKFLELWLSPGLHGQIGHCCCGPFKTEPPTIPPPRYAPRPPLDFLESVHRGWRVWSSRGLSISAHFVAFCCSFPTPYHSLVLRACTKPINNMCLGLCLGFFFCKKRKSRLLTKERFQPVARERSNKGVSALYVRSRSFSIHSPFLLSLSPPPPHSTPSQCAADAVYY